MEETGEGTENSWVLSDVDSNASCTAALFLPLASRCSEKASRRDEYNCESWKLQRGEDRVEERKQSGRELSVDAPEAFEDAAQLAIGDLDLFPLACALGKKTKISWSALGLRTNATDVWGGGKTNLHDVRDDLLVLDVQKPLDKVSIDETRRRSATRSSSVRPPFGVQDATEAQDDPGHVALEIKERL